MNTTSIAKIELKLKDKTYAFLCDNDCLLSEVGDALSIMRGSILQKIDDANKASKEQEEVKIPMEGENV